MIPEAKKNDVPKLEEVPVFMDLTLMVIDESRKHPLQHVTAFALFSSLTFSVKDVYYFGVRLEVGCKSDDLGEEVLLIIDFRYYKRDLSISYHF